MRVPPTAIQPLAREYGKPAAGRGHAETNAASGSGTPAPAQTSSPASEPAAAAHAPGAHSGPKAAPPGLERVLARLQSVPEADRNTGQAMATSRISRNLDRYRETQALVQAPATDPAPPVPETTSTPDTPADSASEPVNANTAAVTPPVVPTPAEEAAGASTDATGTGTAGA